MALRSKPIQLIQRKTSAGTVTYRVTGSPYPGGKQLKFDSTSYEEAEEQRQIWEEQRMRGASASRPKLTYLTIQQIRECEAAFEILKDEGVGLMQVLKAGLTVVADMKANPLEQVDYKTGLARFLAENMDHVSEAQKACYRQRGARFGRFIGEKSPIGKVTEQQMRDWLSSAKGRDGGPISRKTWNNLLGDVAAVFNFFVRKGWLKSTPFMGIKRFNKKALRSGAKKRLSIEQCRTLMAYLEKTHPEWCCYYAITLFAGIRPDTTNGEMWELARCVARDGIDTYYSNDTFHLTDEITKEGQERTTTVRPNLAAWLAAYPPTPKAVCPGIPKIFTELRKMFQLPHDSLRHTAISAFISEGNDYSDAADQFGNSEPIIKRHYLKRMSKEEAAEFYAIMPNNTTHAQTTKVSGHVAKIIF